jgi:hypothetical protein
VKLRLVMKMEVIGTRGEPLEVERDLYLLSLDTARKRGVCPDPSNDNGDERSKAWPWRRR